MGKHGGKEQPLLSANERRDGHARRKFPIGAPAPNIYTADGAVAFKAGDFVVLSNAGATVGFEKELPRILKTGKFQYFPVSTSDERRPCQTWVVVSSKDRNMRVYPNVPVDGTGDGEFTQMRVVVSVADKSSEHKVRFHTLSEKVECKAILKNTGAASMADVWLRTNRRRDTLESRSRLKDAAEVCFYSDYLAFKPEARAARIQAWKKELSAQQSASASAAAAEADACEGQEEEKDVEAVGLVYLNADDGLFADVEAPVIKAMEQRAEALTTDVKSTIFELMRDALARLPRDQVQGVLGSVITDSIFE